MGETLRHRGVGALSVARLREVIAAGSGGFEGFGTWTPGVPVSVTLYAHPKALPCLTELAGAALRAVRIEGRVSTKKDPWGDLKAVVEHGASILEDGALRIGVEFAESRSAPNRHRAQSLSIGMGQGGTFLDFSAANTLLGTDREYAREVFTRLAATGHLPFRVAERGADFFLEGTQGCELRPNHAGIGGANPCAFRIAVPIHGAADSIALLTTIHADLGSGKLFAANWTASTVFDGRPFESMTEGPSVYEAVVRAGLRVESYFVHATLLLTELEGLDALRSACGPKDEVCTSLAAFPLPPYNYFNLSVVTSANGHRLDGESRLPVDIAEIGKTLGVEFAPED